MQKRNVYPNQKEYIVNGTKSAPKVPGNDSFPFNVESLRDFSGNPTNRISCFSAEFFEVIWVLKGSGIIEVDSRSHEIKDNTMYSFSPRQRYTLGPSGRLTGYRICFPQEFLYTTGASATNHFLEGNQSHRLGFCQIDVRADMQAEILEVSKAMVKEYSNDLNFRPQILKGLLRIFIIYYTRIVQQNQPLNQPGAGAIFFKRFADLIKENLTLRRTVVAYARDMQVTPNYLNEMIKKVSGYTASYHIQQHMVQEAKRLAAYPELSMKQIGYQLGFLDIAHFSKFFRNKSGMNFSYFRREMM